MTPDPDKLDEVLALLRQIDAKLDSLGGMSSSSTGRPLRVKEAAAVIGTSERSMYRLARFVGQKNGGTWVISPEALNGLAKTGEANAGQDENSNAT